MERIFCRHLIISELFAAGNISTTGYLEKSSMSTKRYEEHGKGPMISIERHYHSFSGNYEGVIGCSAEYLRVFIYGQLFTVFGTYSSILGNHTLLRISYFVF